MKKVELDKRLGKFLAFNVSAEGRKWKESIDEMAQEIVKEKETKERELFKENQEPWKHFFPISANVKQMRNYSIKGGGFLYEVYPFLDEDIANVRVLYRTILLIDGCNTIKELEYIGVLPSDLVGKTIKTSIFKANPLELKYLAKIEITPAGNMSRDTRSHFETSIPIIYLPRKLKPLEGVLSISVEGRKVTSFNTLPLSVDLFKRNAYKLERVETERGYVMQSWNNPLFEKAREEAMKRNPMPIH